MASPDRKERTAPAAEADVLGEEASNTGKLGNLTGDGSPRADGRGDAQEDGSAEPGADENQAGFMKDQDKKFSP
ncbi:MAG: hypothetical protein ACJ8GO_07310 [Ramlibacter sp.]